FWFTVVQCVIIVATALAAPAIFALPYLAAGIALGQSIAGTVQTVLAILLLRRRLGGLDLRRVLASLGRFTIAAVPAGFAGWGVFLLLGGADGWTNADKLLGAVGTGVIGAVTVAVYALL